MTVTVTGPTKVLSIIGIDSMTSTGSATASLVTGVTGPSNDPALRPDARATHPGYGLRGGTALVTLAVLLVGLPVALYKLGGDPLPQHVPAWSHITTLLLHRDNGTVFLGAVRDISWIAWAAFTVAVVTEAQAALRGRRAPRLRLGGLQNSAGWLVALIVLAFGSQPAAVLASAAPSVVTVSAVRHAPPADQPAHPADLPADYRTEASTADPAAPQVMSMGFSQMVTIRSGDCLWSIAQRYLGNGDLFPEIVKLNLGHDMGGGQKFTDPSVIWPGWVLQLPASPTGLSSADSPATGAPTAGGHAGHHSRDPRFSHPHPAATAPASDPAGAAATPAADPPAASPAPAAASAPAHAAAPSRQEASFARPAELTEISPFAMFGAGVLVGGVSVALARMRRRQRQARRFGRRIPVPVSAPVIAAEQRLRAAEQSYAGRPGAGSAIRGAGTGAAVQPGQRAAVPGRGHAVRHRRGHAVRHWRRDRLRIVPV